MSRKRQKREDYEIDIGWITKKQKMRNPDGDKNQTTAVKIHWQNQSFREYGKYRKLCFSRGEKPLAYDKWLTQQIEQRNKGK